MHGHRWREDGCRWISRTRLEAALGSWPGYIDALEDIFSKIQEMPGWDLKNLPPVRDLLREHEEHVRQRVAEVYGGYHDELKRSMANERHPELKAWRSHNPASSTERPETLRNIRYVKRLEISHPCHVYFLLKGGEVVYVGKTTDAWPKRILQHLKKGDKDFDDVWYLEVDRNSLDRVERRFIEEFKPKYNRTHSTPQSSQIRREDPTNAGTDGAPLAPDFRLIRLSLFPSDLPTVAGARISATRSLNAMPSSLVHALRSR